MPAPKKKRLQAVLSKVCKPIRRHSQVVRQRTANPRFPSSSLGGASKNVSHFEDTAKNAVSSRLNSDKYLFAAENGVTRRSRRFSASIGCFCSNCFGNNGNFHIVHEVEINLHFLLSLAAGLVRGEDNNLLDILVHDSLRQLLHIHILLCQNDKGIQALIHFCPLFHPFLDNVNFKPYEKT